MDPCLLIDFDHTLFDTEGLKQAVANSDLSVETYINQATSLDSFLFPDSLSALEHLTQQTKVYLFSEGPPTYQHHKISKTTVAKIIGADNLLIFPPFAKTNKLKKILTTSLPLALIDNQPQPLAAAQELGITTILINRDHNQHLPHFDLTFSSLKDLINSHAIDFLTDPTSARQSHLVGIKGVGMTALSCILQDQGQLINGSDSSEPQITDPLLSSRNIPIATFDSAASSNTSPIIYSGAYQTQSNPVLISARTHNLPSLPLASALASQVNKKQVIAVCGVGGKTTTTCMLAHTLTDLNTNPSWFVGTSSFSTNLPPGKFSGGPHFVVEADEYATAPPHNLTAKFMHYHPFVTICTNLAFDHPDVYTDSSSTVSTFIRFFNQTNPQGLILLNSATDNLEQIKSKLTHSATLQTYGTDPSADWYLQFNSKTDSYHLNHQSKTWPLQLNLAGDMNYLNATATLAALAFLKLNLSTAIKSLSTFSGSKRRQEIVRIDPDQTIYMDDYAHHPTEITHLISALRQRYPGRRLVLIFQPHTYSRTQALLGDFAQALASADQLILLPIFASARESNPSCSSDDLLSTITPLNHNSFLAKTDSEAITKLQTIKQPSDVIVTVGAGNVYQLHHQL